MHKLRSKNLILSSWKSNLLSNFSYSCFHSKSTNNSVNVVANKISPTLTETTPTSTPEEKLCHNSENIDSELINHLERTSLVDFGNEEALQRLKDAIQFSSTILEVDTKGVEPMITVLEDLSLRLRNDQPSLESNSRQKILSNSKVIEDDYFVSPPGNVPLAPKDHKFHTQKKN